MTPQECADKIAQHRSSGGSVSELLQQHPELAPGLDIVLPASKPRGSGSMERRIDPNTSDLVI